MKSVAPEFCYSGRRFGGKSFIGCAKGYLYALKYPGARVGICREERASMETTTLLTLKQEVIPRIVWHNYWRESKSALYLPNGSEINVFGLDKPGRALGTRYGMVVIDQAEQIDLNQFDTINSSMMQVGMPWHQLLLLFNPDSPEHWAYKRYKPDLGDGKRVDENGRHFADVVHVLPNDLLEYLSEQSRERFDSLSGTFRDRMRLGLWVAFEGAIYPMWSSGRHVIDRPGLTERWGGYPPPEWPRSFACDLGYDNPFACGWSAMDPDGKRHIYRQIYMSRRTIDQHGDAILAQEAEELATLRRCAAGLGREKELAPYLEDLNLDTRWSDHDRGERAILDDMGIPTSPAVKDIQAGIQSVAQALEAGDVFVWKGSLVERDPRLAEMLAPTCLEEEVHAYRWGVKKVSGAGQDKPAADQADHACDWLRYLIHSEAYGARAGVWV
jgi:phage terminase large subunit